MQEAARVLFIQFCGLSHLHQPSNSVLGSGKENNDTYMLLASTHRKRLNKIEDWKSLRDARNIPPIICTNVFMIISHDY